MARMFNFSTIVALACNVLRIKNRFNVFYTLLVDEVNSFKIILAMEKEQMNKSLEALRKYLENMTEQEKEEMREQFRDKKPKGWLSIGEHLPMMFANDIMQGYSVFKVRDKDGNEFNSAVTDHNIWYYRAKDEGITHWFNE